MFQYAAARALALRTGSALRLDLRPLHENGSRAFGLSIFRGFKDELVSCSDSPSGDRLWRIINLFRKNEPVHVERSFSFDESVLGLAPPVRLRGYFQTERYFKDYEEAIRDDFIPGEALGAEVDALQKRIMPSGKTVSLHIRRGDYVSDEAQLYHGLLPVDYYLKAISKVREMAGDSTICVFTDDVGWSKASLGLPDDTVFVSEHTKSAGQDLILMSRCSHHITANSTFSWWGAWLNPAPDKVVVTPDRWFTPQAGVDARDLRPNDWLRI